MKTITLTEDEIRSILNEIPDPEVPAISIVELGVVRDIRITDDGVEIDITPTYSGCPALKTMEDDVRAKMQEHHIPVKIKTIFKHAWTTEWMSEETKEKLRAYGIAPPQKISFANMHPFSKERTEPLACPFCSSTNTKLTSQFGSTACKALYFCDNCHQPFEHFKCH
jgi:ring-1,2-phenylacetyl-CoA epoxidase subunit PaaD